MRKIKNCFRELTVGLQIMGVDTDFLLLVLVSCVVSVSTIILILI